MPPGRPGDVVGAELRPVEPVAQRRKRLWHEVLMYLDNIQDRGVRVDTLEVVYDVPDGRFSTAEVEAGFRAQRVRPRWRQECDDAAAGRVTVFVEQHAVVPVLQLDWGVERRNVARGHVEDGPFELKADPIRSRQVPKNCEQAVA